MKTKSPQKQVKLHKIIQSIMQENYAEADKYLQEVINYKIAQKMSKHKSSKLFK